MIVRGKNDLRYACEMIGLSRSNVLVGVALLAWAFGGCGSPVAPDPALSTRPITFVQQSGAWLPFRINADGSGLEPVVIPEDNAIYPAISADGSSIAYISEGPDGGVFVMPLAGGISRRVHLSASVDGLAWSPDGTQLLLAEFLESIGRVLRVLDLVNGGILDLGQGFGEPSWSPDGRTVLAVSFEGPRAPGIYALSSNGLDPRLIIAGTAVGVRDPSWSPDGSRIVFARGYYSASFIFSARPDGSDERQLTIPGSGEFFTDLGPVWSPEGARIAFQRHHFQCTPTPCSGRYDIFLMNADGSELTNLTLPTWGGVRPTW